MAALGRALLIALAGTFALLSGSVSATAPPLIFDSPVPERLELRGAVVAEDDMKPVLVTGRDAYALYDTGQVLDSRSGTISFWVKPTWAVGDRRSHTLLSMPWNADLSEYLVISQGFYKKKSERNFYFVVNNRHISCDSDFQLQPGKWAHVIATWGQGKESTCKVFVDGVKIAERVKRAQKLFETKAVLHLGSDRGSINQRKRGADAMLANLRITGSETTDSEAWNLFTADVQQFNAADGAGRLSPYPWIDELLSAHGPAPAVRDAANRIIEPRVILDPDIFWSLSKRNTNELIQWVKDAGFNVLVTSVWQGRGVKYLRDGVPVEDRVRHRLARGDDPLMYLLNTAHAAGIEVHAWFNVIQRRAEILDSFYDDGTPDNAFDVHNAAFRDFIVDLVVDVARRYPVDGINLDHIRAMGICASEACNEDYSRRFGRSLALDRHAWRVSTVAADSVSAWNGSAVRDIVMRIRDGIAETKPDLPLSVDAHPLHKGLLLQGQDSIAWANDGLIDRIFDMDYKTRPDFETIQRVAGALDVPGKLTILFSTYETTGEGRASRDPALLAAYIEISRRILPGTGAAFYHRKDMSALQIAALKNSAYREPAVPRCASGSLLSADRLGLVCE